MCAADTLACSNLAMVAAHLFLSQVGAEAGWGGVVAWRPLFHHASASALAPRAAAEGAWVWLFRLPTSVPAPKPAPARPLCPAPASMLQALRPDLVYSMLDCWRERCAGARLCRPACTRRRSSASGLLAWRLGPGPHTRAIPPTQPPSLPHPPNTPHSFTESDVGLIVTLLQACGLQLRAGARSGGRLGSGAWL